MTEREFLNAIWNGRQDVLQVFLDALSTTGVDYCVIGGLAVNAFVEPVVSLDLDVIITSEEIEIICKAVEAHFKIERFPHSVNLSTKESDLRIQLQTDPRYQRFIGKGTIHSVLGYKMKVASIEDVLQGKIWAYSDDQRRKSKRQKDLADIARLIEAYPYLKDCLPDEIRNRLE
jgi:hypothetical protein